MEVRLALNFVLFASFCLVDGCSCTNICSAYAECHIHRRKRSLDNQERDQIENADRNRTYSITLQGDPCNFDTYDDNRDGTITKGELEAILCINEVTDALFSDLNAITDDGVIKPDEFIVIAPMIITDCFSSDK
ncbi:uncharacterized protein LOC123543997 isoform X2 [Mercenaria mercenaria]|uniref:uncharacterized protein LOC123543997 isoform X2 n=1 Tax=Mercenaria mercenaria TaxID=6596 RepID=UPI001E1E11E6|nr:uncharacterized protein LOC123543997 isoform X2 [Mercenaria mercenaria]